MVKNTPPMDEDMVCVCPCVARLPTRHKERPKKYEKMFDCADLRSTNGKSKIFTWTLPTIPTETPSPTQRACSCFFGYFFSPCLCKNQWNTCSLGNTCCVPGHGTPRRRRARRCRNEPGHRRLRGERPPHRSRSRAQGHRRQNVLGKPSQASSRPQEAFGEPQQKQLLGAYNALALEKQRLTRSPPKSEQFTKQTTR